MDPKFWNKPICFESASSHEWRIVDSTAEAALILMNQWPLATGKKLLKARKICIKVLEGKGSVDKARMAFVKAAKEAHIPVEG